MLRISKSAVVKVGNGRGFVVADIDDYFVITAAHCLPHYPEPHLARGVDEETYANIIGPLDGEQTIWATLLFFDAMSDIAVLGAPDSQALSDELERYKTFIMYAIEPLSIADLPRPPPRRPPTKGVPGFVLSLDGTWQRCVMTCTGRFVIAVQGEDQIRSGMSGSPIIRVSGEAVGVISTGSGAGNMNPSVMNCLPRWLLAKLIQKT